MPFPSAADPRRARTPVAPGKLLLFLVRPLAAEREVHRHPSRGAEGTPIVGQGGDERQARSRRRAGPGIEHHRQRAPRVVHVHAEPTRCAPDGEGDGPALAADDLDPPPGRQNAPLPPLTLLQAYGELAATKPQYAGPYLKVLAQLEKSDPDNALVQAAVGRRELKSGNFAVAAEHLQHALSLGRPLATTCADLADALTHLDRKSEAVTWLDKSIQLDPFNPFTQRTLIVRLIDLKQYPRARAALEHYVEVFPQDTFMRQMLAKARAQPVQ